MNTLKMAWYNMKQRLLATILTSFLVTIGVGLISSIFTVRDQVDQSFSRGVAGRFDLVVGPKGSSLQLVLNAVFHLDKPLGNIPYEFYDRLCDDTRRVELAIPMAMGDSVKGFRLIGTNQDFLTKFEHRKGETFRFSSGRPFDLMYEAVIGAEVARRTGMKVDNYFPATHGIESSGQTHEHNFRVVGVLEPTGTPHDRAIFCDLKSVWELHRDPTASSMQRNLSAILVRLKYETDLSFSKEINDDVKAQAVMPSTGIRDLQSLFGNVQGLIMAVSYLVLLAAGVSIFVSLYNSMSERRREIAIIRAMGAPAGTIFQMILLESAIICLIGAVVGVTLSHVGLVVLQSALRDATGLVIFAGLPGMDDVLLIAGALVLGLVSAVIPAVNAYRTDVATHIRPVA